MTALTPRKRARLRRAAVRALGLAALWIGSAHAQPVRSTSELLEVQPFAAASADHRVFGVAGRF